jgi:hypothetical protein
MAWEEVGIGAEALADYDGPKPETKSYTIYVKKEPYWIDQAMEQAKRKEALKNQIEWFARELRKAENHTLLITDEAKASAPVWDPQKLLFGLIGFAYPDGQMILEYTSWEDEHKNGTVLQVTIGKPPSSVS